VSDIIFLALGFAAFGLFVLYTHGLWRI